MNLETKNKETIKNQYCSYSFITDAYWNDDNDKSLRYT